MLYGSDRNRIQQTSNAGVTTYVFAGNNVLFERLVLGGTTTNTHYIYAGGEQVGTFVTKTGTANQTRYFHRDHLGSVDAVTNDAGNVIERMSYDAWGKRRNGDWTDAAGPVTVTSTLRGFTGHEHIDQVGLIHMNGRVYNPTLGRFVSADPFIQAPELSQSYNRYTYVLNNPLSLTDPTGYFFGFLKKLFKGIGNLFKSLFKTIFRNFRSLFMIGLSFIPGLGQAGAIALGFIGGVVASGGDLKAGIIGAITAAAFWQIGHGVIGQKLGTATSSHGFLDGIHLKKIIAHGVVGGASAELQGGKFYQGFLSAGTTQAFSPLIGEFRFKPIRVAIASGIGGTASVLGGGKFGNGALTGAFSRLFNDEWDHTWQVGANVTGIIGKGYTLGASGYVTVGPTPDLGLMLTWGDGQGFDLGAQAFFGVSNGNSDDLVVESENFNVSVFKWGASSSYDSHTGEETGSSSAYGIGFGSPINVSVTRTQGARVISVRREITTSLEFRAAAQRQLTDFACRVSGRC